MYCLRWSSSADDLRAWYYAIVALNLIVARSTLPSLIELLRSVSASHQTHYLNGLNLSLLIH
jgi:hypothetical protein